MNKLQTNLEVLHAATPWPQQISKSPPLNQPNTSEEERGPQFLMVFRMKKTICKAMNLDFLNF